ncbi:hypothetical protein QFI91_08890 [Raoultella sp. WB_B2P2-3]|jgi:hypothetical protein|uniref:Glycosyltransferase n=1 Tax=Raoultella scottii TaxID=3040937 RepID=A0ABU8Z7Y7_9ENTR|nr:MULTISPECIES: hypothetical protein [Enterobacteriaceae]MVT04733.1 hypothetical protein [Raoultella sp. 10-1]PAC09679.1 hypothetical protein CD006_19275 [Enterobacter sp. 10-1]
MKIVTVLRSGGDYNHDHVQWLYKQLPDNIEKICFTDLIIPGVQTIKLTENLPGWWSKIEIFDPQKVDDDIFYIDLDVVVVGDITDILQNTRLTMLSDFFFPQKTKNSAIMRIPHEEKFKVWEAFRRYPQLFMTRYQSGGDQEFISKIYPQASIWQDILPGQIVSYKKHVISKKKNEHAIGNGSVPVGTRIVCFHGKPRPWDCGEVWVPPFVKS